MLICDHKGRGFLYHPHTNNGFFFLLATKYLILYLENMKKASRNSEYAEMRHGDVILMPTCGCFLSFPWAGTDISHG